MEKMLTGSPLDFAVRARIAERAAEFRLDLDDKLAVSIVNRLSEAFNRK